jgi:hypothetical protein
MSMKIGAVPLVLFRASCCTFGTSLLKRNVPYDSFQKQSRIFEIFVVPTLQLISRIYLLGSPLHLGTYKEILDLS